MLRNFSIFLLAALAACSSPPPIQNPALLEEGPYPNLADVPPRPKPVLGMRERMSLQAELEAENKQMAPLQKQAVDKNGHLILPQAQPLPPKNLSDM